MNTRHFTVKGNINCVFEQDSVVSEDQIQNIDVQLWQKQPMEIVFLGNALTNQDGDFTVEFSVESPVANIVDGKMDHVFIRAYYNGTLLNPPEIDLDAEVYFSQLSPPPSEEYKEAVLTLVKQLKEDGNWSKLDRLWIHATEHRQHARVSLVNPSSEKIAEVNSPAWTENEGYTGNGSTSYLNSNFNPTVSGENYSLNSASMFVYSRTEADTDMTEMGIADFYGIYSYLKIRVAGRFVVNINNTGSDFYEANDSSLGLHAGVRTNDTTQKIFKNGTQLGSDIYEASAGIPNDDCFVLAYNAEGGPNGYSTRQIALSGLGSGEINQVLFYSSIQAFATTVGFNV